MAEWHRKYTDDKMIDTYETGRSAKIPIIAFLHRRSRKVEVAPWPEGRARRFVNLDGKGGTNDGYVCVIPQGKSLNPRGTLEERVFVVEGNGATTICKGREEKQPSSGIPAVSSGI